MSDLSSRTAPCARCKSQIIPDDPLLTPREAAAERGQALSTFWRDVKRGLVPPAIRVGPRMRRWRRSELRADLESRREAAR